MSTDSASNVRIRYKEVSPGMLVSRRLFTTSAGQEVKAELDLELKNFRIVDSVSGAVVASGGNTKNKSVLKLQCKKKMVELGISFAEETRDRGNSEAGASTRQTT